MQVEITEVGPRDGLQNEKAAISVADKAALICACAAAGLSRIEVGSFVNPKRVPQMAETGDVLQALAPAPGVSGMVLIPNARRLREFLAARAQSRFDLSEVAVFVSASEAFSEANLGCRIAESLRRVQEIFDALPGDDLTVRGYISCATDCPFTGEVPPEAVERLAGNLKALGCHTIALADTIGKGTPHRVAKVFEATNVHWRPDLVTAHFHDTAGLALANVDVALAAGIRRFDSSVAGLGGCPYAPGAPGNLATETLVTHVESLGYTTGIDRLKLREAAALARRMVGGADVH